MFETGLDYFGARYMSGAMGRFTSPDPLLASGRPVEPQTWNRYAYVGNNPLRYIDPSGLDYYDQNGNRLGTDGNTQGNHDVVTEKKEIAAIKKAEENRGQTALADVNSATLLPDAQAREAIDAAVNRSNAPTTGLVPPGQEDNVGGFHEEGFAQGPNATGGTSIFTMTTGAAGTPGQQASISIDQGTANSQVNGLPNLVVHVHPAGTSGSNIWRQSPSPADRAAALPGVSNVVVGAGNRTLYFYDSQRTVATFPLDSLRNLP